MQTTGSSEGPVSVAILPAPRITMIQAQGRNANDVERDIQAAKGNLMTALRAAEAKRAMYPGLSNAGSPKPVIPIPGLGNE